MCVDDGTELRWGCEAGHEGRRHGRRYCEDYVSIVGHYLVVAEIQRCDLAVRKTERTQAMPKYDLRTVLA